MAESTVPRRIAVLTSGGDAPGMNAAIRAVTRTAIAHDVEVYGVRRGYSGLVAGDFVRLGPRDVGGILERAGTILGTSRFKRMIEPEVREEARTRLAERGIDALVAIGGNGTQAGASALSSIGVPVVGVASTIDNDVRGTDISLGVDTALHVAVEAIDRLRATASSHRRAFLVEVMGRDSGYLALAAGIASGAEAIVLPERETSAESVADEIRGAYDRGKSHAIVVVAEGAQYPANALLAYFETHSARLGFDCRAIVLGHVQRGGTPTPFDRLLGTRMGAHAVERVLQGQTGVLVGLRKGETVGTPFTALSAEPKPLFPDILRLAPMLAQ